MRHIAERGRLEFGIVGRVEEERLVQEQRDRPCRRSLASSRRQPVELLGLAGQPRIHHQRIQADEAPAGGLKAPAVVAEHGDDKPAASFSLTELRGRRANLGRIVADVVIAGQIAAGEPAAPSCRDLANSRSSGLVGPSKAMSPLLMTRSGRVASIYSADARRKLTVSLVRRRARCVSEIWVRRNSVMDGPSGPIILSAGIGIMTVDDTCCGRML